MQETLAQFFVSLRKYKFQISICNKSNKTKNDNCAMSNKEHKKNDGQENKSCINNIDNNDNNIDINA